MELRVWKNEISDVGLSIAHAGMWKCNLQQDMSSGQNLALVECDSSLDWLNQTEIRVKILRQLFFIQENLQSHTEISWQMVKRRQILQRNTGVDIKQ